MRRKHSVILAFLCGQMLFPAPAFALSHSQAAANRLAIQNAVAEINAITDSYTVTESNKPAKLNGIAKLKIDNLTAPFGIRVNATKIDEVASLLDADWDLVADSESEANLFLAGITLPIVGWRKTIFENIATDSSLVLWFDEQQTIQRITYINHTESYFSEFSKLLDQQPLKKGSNSTFGKDYHKSFFGIFANESTVEWITHKTSYHNADLDILVHRYKAGLASLSEQFLAANNVDYQTLIKSDEDYYLELGSEDYANIIWAEEPYEGESLTLVSKAYANVFNQTLCETAQLSATPNATKNTILTTFGSLDYACNMS